MGYFVHLEMHQHLSNTSKFYRLYADGGTLYSFWGRVGQKGQSKVQPCVNAEHAQVQLHRVEHAKSLNGYKLELSGPVPAGLITDKANNLERVVQNEANSQVKSVLDETLHATSAQLGLLVISQWSEWRKGWDWRENVAAYLETCVKAVSKDKNSLLVAAPLVFSQELSRFDQRSQFVTSLSEPTDEFVLDTALSLWEPYTPDSGLASIKEAFATASLI